MFFKGPRRKEKIKVQKDEMKGNDIEQKIVSKYKLELKNI